MADAGTAPRRRDLTTGPIGPTLLAFALPTLGSSVLQSLNGSVNAIWVGRFLGEDALAATTNGNLVMFLLMAFVFGFSMASTILIGQAFGRGDIDRARQVTGTAVGTFVAVAVAISIVGWLFARTAAPACNPGEAMPLALAYCESSSSECRRLDADDADDGAAGKRGFAEALWFMGLNVALDAVLNPVSSSASAGTRVGSAARRWPRRSPLT